MRPLSINAHGAPEKDIYYFGFLGSPLSYGLLAGLKI